MKHKLIMENWRGFINEYERDYSKARQITNTPVHMATEKESMIALSGFTDNGTYTLSQGPYIIDKTYMVVIVEYRGWELGLYSTSGFSSDGQEGTTDTKWVLTGGFSPDGTRIKKMPNHYIELNGEKTLILGKYPVQYSVYEDVLEDLSNKLDPKLIRQKIYDTLVKEDKKNWWSYLRTLYPSMSKMDARKAFEAERVQFFNSQLSDVDAQRSEDGMSDWIEIIRDANWAGEIPAEEDSPDV